MKNNKINLIIKIILVKSSFLKKQSSKISKIRKVWGIFILIKHLKFIINNLIIIF